MKGEITLSSSIKKTFTISDVRIVPTYWILVDISRIENMQTMRFLSTILTLLGGVLAGLTYPSGFLLLGIVMVIIGLILEYLKVHKVMREWVESERRGTISYTGSTITDPSEFEQTQEKT